MQSDWIAEETVQARIRDCRPAAVMLGSFAFGVESLMVMVEVFCAVDAAAPGISRVGESAWSRWGGEPLTWMFFGQFISMLLVSLVSWAATAGPVLFGVLRGRALALAVAVAVSVASLVLRVGHAASLGGVLVSLMPWGVAVLAVSALALGLLLSPGSLRWFFLAADERWRTRLRGVSTPWPIDASTLPQLWKLDDGGAELRRHLSGRLTGDRDDRCSPEPASHDHAGPGPG
jgi:hypothetical protein